ncbi:pectin esterase [Echinicola soli]|uniref:Pectinesterase n=1 Tax=Echinicola soli TaxID=2591634 RepID=A0A514CK66_9BACT|nr:pectinesterase family protein [Echinicola soli]QDH80202.1 pectin esterase [Echinicola soli]
MKTFFKPYRLVLLWMVLVSCSSSEEAEPDEMEEKEEISIDFMVDQNGEGDFTTVQAAIDAARPNLFANQFIYIKNGIYKEEIVVPKGKNNLVLVGESKEEVILTFDNAADKVNEETGEKYGTSGSSSTFVHGEGFVAINITFENSAGTENGPALALYVNSDKSIFYNCRFLGRQDTFYGNRKRIFLKNCYIEGTVDFIFGPATAVFENCKIHSYGGTSITAASTEEYVDFGFVFRDCELTAEEGISTDLGRPWRPHAAVAYINCKMGDLIKPSGWNNWGNTDNELTARFVEYGNTGAGAVTSKRVDWAVQLSESEAEAYNPLNVLKTTYAENQVTDNWDPYEFLETISELIK